MAVLFNPVEGTKIQEWEMMLSAGAVYQNLLVAAQYFNYAAQWLTEWYAYKYKMIEKLGGILSKDKIAGFIYIGVKDDEPNERKRPIYNEFLKFL